MPFLPQKVSLTHKLLIPQWHVKRRLASTTISPGFPLKHPSSMLHGRLKYKLPKIQLTNFPRNLLLLRFSKSPSHCARNLGSPFPHITHPENHRILKKSTQIYTLLHSRVGTEHCGWPPSPPSQSPLTPLHTTA